MKEWFGTSFFFISLLYMTLIKKSHVHIATSSTQKTNQLWSEEMHWNWHPPGLVLRCFYENILAGISLGIINWNICLRAGFLWHLWVLYWDWLHNRQGICHIATPTRKTLQGINIQTRVHQQTSQVLCPGAAGGHITL